MPESKLVTPKTWEEFRATGLLWWINCTLHLFGWAIVVNVEQSTDKIVDCYPARVKFRGFDEKVTEEQYKVLTSYMKDHGEELLAEANEE